MFDLVRKLTQKAASSGHGVQIRLLAITQDAEDWKILRDVAGECGWALFWADSCDAALAVLSDHTIPIVICDRDLPHAEWRTVLKRISLFRQPICILLASSVSDEYLWREVIQHQGFDVLPKPFEPERVKRIMDQAHSWGARMCGQAGGGA